MSTKRSKDTTKYSRICPDSRNADKDYYIPTERAKQLYNEGKLAQDLTNSNYANGIVYMPVGNFDARMKNKYYDLNIPNHFCNQ